MFQEYLIHRLKEYGPLADEEPNLCEYVNSGGSSISNPPGLAKELVSLEGFIGRHFPEEIPFWENAKRFIRGQMLKLC